MGSVKISETINELRKQKGLSIEELSNLAGVPKSTLSKITAGITKNPNLDTVQAILSLLDVLLIILIIKKLQTFLVTTP